LDAVRQRLNLPQWEVFTSRAKLTLMLCGAGTGKSHEAGYLSYNYIQQFPHVKGFIGANFYRQLDKATLERCKEVWSSFGINEYSKENPSGRYVCNKIPPPHFKTDLHRIDDYNGTICFINGGMAITGSMDNAKAHDGTQYGWMILDETKDTKEEDVKDIMIPRVRENGIYVKPSGILTPNKFEGKAFNPIYFLTTPAKVQWLNKLFDLENHIAEIEANIYDKKKAFVLNVGNRKVVIASTYHNEHNLPEGYIDDYISTLSQERVKAMIYGNPFSSSGGEFYSSFSRLEHVSDKAVYDPELPIHVSFDQNTVPYNSCSIWQISPRGDRWVCSAVGEICLKNPKNSTEEVCDEILRQYGDCKAIFYYGDASGYNRSTLDKETKHHYQVIERTLARKLVNGSKRTYRKNPALTSRRDLFNLIFENKSQIIIQINPKCSNLVADFTYIKQDIDGGKKKEIEVNKETGERYQKYGHLSDTADYFIYFINEMLK
jgi:hypothetical protein